MKENNIIQYRNVENHEALLTQKMEKSGNDSEIFQCIDINEDSFSECQNGIDQEFTDGSNHDNWSGTNENSLLVRNKIANSDFHSLESANMVERDHENCNKKTSSGKTVINHCQYDHRDGIKESGPDKAALMTSRSVQIGLVHIPECKILKN